MKKINHWINGKNVAGSDYFHTTNPASGEVATHAFHFHHHFIPRYHVGQSFWRAGGDHVARLQSHEFAQVCNQVWDAEDQIRRGPFLT